MRFSHNDDINKYKKRLVILIENGEIMVKKYKPKEKKDNKALYMSLFIAFIMITSAFGVMFYGFGTEETVTKYGKYKFKATNQGYKAKINGNEYYFEALPQDLETVNVSLGTKFSILNGQMVVITSDPDSTYKQEIALAQFNLNQVLMSLNKQVGNGFTAENDMLPVVTCSNASTEVPVIEMVEADRTEAVLEDYCIKIKFDSSFNLKRVNSKILYLLLGVLDEEY